jgi:hypothetical protein
MGQHGQKTVKEPLTKSTRQVLAALKAIQNVHLLRVNSAFSLLFALLPLVLLTWSAAPYI